MKTTLSLIVASAKNFAIGKNNHLLCSLPRDMAWFREHTLGKTVVMGRKTFESIGRPLPKRINIILSRQVSETFQDEKGVIWVNNLEAAVNNAESEEVMIIGGAEIYRQALPLADRIYFTEIQAELDGDSFFPAINLNDWQIKKDCFHEKDENNPYDLRFLILERD